MTLPSFNFTGRKKIPRKDLKIKVRKESSSLGGETSLLLSASYEGNGKFPANSRLYLEPYRGPTRMHFELGTLGNQTPLYDRSLKSFPTEMDLRLLKFDFYIVDGASRNGALLGLAEKIPLSVTNDTEASEKGLLPTRPHNLGERIWKLDLTSDDPALLINERIYEDRYTYTDDVLFQSLVFPQIAEKLAEWILQKADLEEEESSWQTFFKKELGQDPNREERGFELNSENDHDIQLKEEWIDQAVKVFCNTHKFRSLLEKEMG